MEEKLMHMLSSYQQELAQEQAKRIQAEAELNMARQEIETLKQRINQPAETPPSS